MKSDWIQDLIFVAGVTAIGCGIYYISSIEGLWQLYLLLLLSFSYSASQLRKLLRIRKWKLIFLYSVFLLGFPVLFYLVVQIKDYDLRFWLALTLTPAILIWLLWGIFINHAYEKNENTITGKQFFKKQNKYKN